MIQNPIADLTLEEPPCGERLHEEHGVIVGDHVLERVGVGAERLAQELGAGFIPVRKPGKLPATVMKESYNLEYGKDALEIHVDAIEKGQRILVVDDVLATGGTAAATAQLVRKLGGELLGMAFLIELSFLDGKSKLPGEQVFSVLQY